MKKSFQIVLKYDGISPEILETVPSREEAEYVVAHYLLHSDAKLYNMEIVEVGGYVPSYQD